MTSPTENHTATMSPGEEVAESQGALFEGMLAVDPGVLLREFAETVIEIKRRKAEIKALEEKKGRLDRTIREEVFTALGVRSMKTELGTISMRVDIRASGGGNRDAAAQALIGHGLSEYVKLNFNSQSVAAWVRDEIAKARAELGDESLAMEFPELVRYAIGDLADYLAVSEVPSLTFSANRG